MVEFVPRGHRRWCMPNAEGVVQKSPGSRSAPGVKIVNTPQTPKGFYRPGRSQATNLLDLRCLLRLLSMGCLLTHDCTTLSELNGPWWHATQGGPGAPGATPRRLTLGFFVELLRSSWRSCDSRDRTVDGRWNSAPFALAVSCPLAVQYRVPLAARPPVPSEVTLTKR